MMAIIEKLAELVGGSSVPSAASGQYGPVLPSSQIDFKSIFSTGLTLASAASEIFGANAKAGYELASSQQQARALKMQSAEAALDAKREETRSKQESNQIMDNLIQTIAAQQLSFASNGIDLSFGTPANVADATRNIANLQLSTARSDSTIRAIARRRQGAALREESLNVLTAGEASAKNTRMTGLIGAGGKLAELKQRRDIRG